MRKCDPHNFILSIILSFVIFLSYIVLSNKEGLYLDEILSFQQANYEYVSFDEIYEAAKKDNIKQLVETVQKRESNEIFTRQDFLEKCYVTNHDRAFKYSKIYAYETGNVHPPLYHFLLHTICSISKSSNLYLNGYGVNIFFLLIACFILYKIAFLTTRDKNQSLLAVISYGFSYGFLNSVVFFRMYSLLTFWLVLTLYIYLLYQISNYKKKYFLIVIFFLHFWAMFTHYFAVFYIIPLFVYTTISMYKTNRIALKAYIWTTVLSGFLFFSLWPFSILQFILSDRGHEVQSNVLAVSSFIQILKYIRVLIRSVFGFESLFAILAFIGIYIVASRSNVTDLKTSFKNSRLSIIIILALSYFFCSAKLSPWVSFRYISPIFPLVSMLTVLCIHKGLSLIINNRRHIIVLSALCVLSITLVSNAQPIEHQYTMTREKKQFLENHIGDTAIIVNAQRMPIYGEVVQNLEHVLYKRTTEGSHLQFLSDNLLGEKYVLYIDKFCNLPNILNDLETLNFTYSSVNYKTDFHNIYVINKQLNR